MIDLRSDTVTKPDEPMRRAIADAAVGDDVYGEDPTVLELEAYVAGLLGKEAALFVPSGVMSNQLALAVQTTPGDEVIVGRMSHIFNYENAAPALLSGIQLHPVREIEGAPDPDEVAGAIRSSAYYLAQTRLLSHEITHNAGGGVIGREGIFSDSIAIARDRGLALHLDGARLFNAVVATGRSAADFAEPYDTISICLSKGLGAPIGSLLVGSNQTRRRAMPLRKAWGGGWRQAGLLAAAGLYALRNNVERLADDHARATRLAKAIEQTSGLALEARPMTNIVMFRVDGGETLSFVERLKERGLLVSEAFPGKIRAVLHKDVSDRDLNDAIEALRETISHR